MSSVEKYSRREFITMAAGVLLTAAAVSVPLGRKFIAEASQEGGAVEKTSQASSQSVEKAPGRVESVEEKKVEVSQVEEKQEPVQGVFAEVGDGAALIERMGLKDKVVYIVYGRPGGWGTLGSCSWEEADGCWQVANEQKIDVSLEIGVSQENFAYTILNPAYNSGGWDLSDEYIQQALELAPENKGLVAPVFNDVGVARGVLERWGREMPPHLLKYLSVSLDVEHMPGGQVEAQALNKFISFYADLRQQWDPGEETPGFVLTYAFRLPRVDQNGVEIVDGSGDIRGLIRNLNQMQQYNLIGNVMAPVISDGYGSYGAKFEVLKGMVNSLPNSKAFPAVVGTMEFYSRHREEYDTSSIEATFRGLDGAPVKFLASQ